MSPRLLLCHGCDQTPIMATWISELRAVMVSDGIDYQKTGYINLVKSCMAALSLLKSRPAGKASKNSYHFWHGLRSPFGGQNSQPLDNQQHILKQGWLVWLRQQGIPPILPEIAVRILECFLFFTLILFHNQCNSST